MNIWYASLIVVTCTVVLGYLAGYLAASAGAQRWLNFYRWWK